MKLKLPLAILGALVVIFLCWFVPARTGLLASDRAAMNAKYAGAPSTFVKVDGVDMHVRVEGHGPTVLMLHGTGVNLHEWDPLAERLKPYYTVVRLDWPPYGLSTPDPKQDFSTRRAAELVGLVIDRLKIDKLAIIATSNGCNVGLAYAAAHPERMTAMTFSMLPLERPSQTRATDWKILQYAGFAKAVDMPGYHPLFFYRWAFQDTSHPGWDVPEYLPRLMYDMSNLPGAIERQQKFLKSNADLFKATDMGAVAEKITVPVLLQWSDRDTVISQSAEASVRRFTHTHVALIHYPNVGHWPMWEIPDRFAADIKQFLDRNLKGSSIRQTFNKQKG
jgi:pimeloyl-ACP methyl ester carboxylesterase